jgi:hypothetical protein
MPANQFLIAGMARSYSPDTIGTISNSRTLSSRQHAITITADLSAADPSSLFLHHFSWVKKSISATLQPLPTQSALYRSSFHTPCHPCSIVVVQHTLLLRKQSSKPFIWPTAGLPAMR